MFFTVIKFVLLYLFLLPETLHTIVLLRGTKRHCECEGLVNVAHLLSH